MEDEDWRYNPFSDNHREQFHSILNDAARPRDRDHYDYAPADDHEWEDETHDRQRNYEEREGNHEPNDNHNIAARFARDVYDTPQGVPLGYEDFDRQPTPHYFREPSNQSPRPTQSTRPPVDGPSSISALFSRTSGLQLPRRENMASSAPRRFAGDGYDYRRPVSSAARAVAREQDAGSVDLTGDEGTPIDLSGDDVIDLTADDSGYGASQDGNGRQRDNNEEQNRGRRINYPAPRLPRGMDIIIDLDNGEEDWRMATPAPEPSSPEIQFVSSRQLSPQNRPQPRFGGNNPDDDEVEFVSENALPADEVRRRREREREREREGLDNVMDLFGTLNGRFTHLRAQVDRYSATLNRTANGLHRLHQEPVAPNRRGNVHVHTFVAPMIMDFDAVGFEFGPRARVPEPPPPTYEAPPKASDGFTRSPEEEGECLVCPNCEDELCVGEGDLKRQVWIVKGCGHVSSHIIMM
jgi:hypothetical protein